MSLTIIDGGEHRGESVPTRRPFVEQTRRQPTNGDPDRPLEVQNHDRQSGHPKTERTMLLLRCYPKPKQELELHRA